MLKSPIDYYNDVILSDEERVETTLVEGDPRVGTVYYLPQAHRTPDHSDLERRKVGIFQLKLLIELLRLNLEDLFVEGLLESKYPLNEQRTANDQDFIHVLEGLYHAAERSLIPDDVAEKTIGLTYEGAARCYHVIKKNVTLHATNTRGVERMRNMIVNRKKEVSGRFFLDLIHIFRERSAVKLINIFLAKNPGQKVGLVYGAAHDFSSHFSRMDEYSRPVLKVIAFPRLLSSFTAQSD